MLNFTAMIEQDTDSFLENINNIVYGVSDVSREKGGRPLTVDELHEYLLSNNIPPTDKAQLHLYLESAQSTEQFMLEAGQEPVSTRDIMRELIGNDDDFALLSPEYVYLEPTLEDHFGQTTNPLQSIFYSVIFVGGQEIQATRLENPLKA